MKRAILAMALVLLLSLDTYSGVAKIIGFYQGNRGARALSRAELDLALESLRASVGWLPHESTFHVTIGRVVAMAQANGLPLAALGERSQLEILAFGVGATARGIALNPADTWGWFNLGGVYSGYGDAHNRLERMIAAGNRASAGGTSHELPPDSRRFSLEDHVAASAAVMARQMDPEFFFYCDHLAGLYSKAGLEDRAAEELRKSLALMPLLELHPSLEDEEIVRTFAEPILQGIAQAASNPYIYPSWAARARATILEQLERHEEAIDAWHALSDLGGEDYAGESDLAIGMIEQARGRFKESIPFLERAAETGRRGFSAVTALYYLGTAHARLGDHEAAVAYYRRHLVVSPSSLGGYLGLAESLDRIGRTREAEESYIAAVRKFPENKTTYELTIRHMVLNGRERAAEPYAEALLKKDPGNKTALALLKKLKQGPFSSLQ